MIIMITKRIAGKRRLAKSFTLLLKNMLLKNADGTGIESRSYAPVTGMPAGCACKDLLC